ncbi:MAG: acyl-CoA dehydrogenase family protein [Sphingomonas sp.]|uniref:acyl-CoA dehydrogenase family protein n=1 Tax=Sphingomonas sp. TaxID=28214 RepID=UPI001AD0AE42|nr:acyl-CoA dehydrogenase family protein [Sphingomonas sp.]MBN8816347.1 acyl-CoA dehydrogenase family protein [Sphingomonas sp.]
MRASIPPASVDVIIEQMRHAPGLARLRSLSDSFAAATDDAMATIVSEAAKFAAKELGPLNLAMDDTGATLVDGRVATAPGHAAAWRSFVAQGWPMLEHAEVIGGQGLPRLLAIAVQEIFDRHCPAFGMLPVAQRSAVKLVDQFGPDHVRAEWLPLLVSGDWGATICISEAGAGSDVGRILTSARPRGDGSWAVSGEKMWISFGDQNLTARIGHCLLARTPGAAPGPAGLSLFLVPDWLPEPDGSPRRNGISVRRIESKLGLHGSPTCALGFDDSTGWLLGTEGRGLAQMFAMITSMRLAVGAQGLGIAAGSADLAMLYARERRQGGGGAVAQPIIEHPDVQRELAGQAATTEILRGLLYALAVQADLAAHEPDDKARRDAESLSQWLLPIVKTFGADSAFNVSSSAMQVLGGAGYTGDWPVEQNLRDSRVLSIFEGATGIQALDLVERRLLRSDGLEIFRTMARDTANSGDGAGLLFPCLDLLDDAATRLISFDSNRDRRAAATSFLRLSILAAGGWMAAHLLRLSSGRPTNKRLRASAMQWLSDIEVRAAVEHWKIIAGEKSISSFHDL